MIRRIFGYLTITISIIGGITSILWWAKDEPTTVLILSWLAITYTGIDILFTAQVKEEGTKKGGD